MKQRLLFVLVIVPLFAFAQLTPKSVIFQNDTIGFYEFKPPGYDTSTGRHPLLIFLHGVGERGNGNTELPRVLLSSFPKFIKGSTMTFTVHGRKESFLLLVPQMSMLYMDWENYYVDAMINYAKSNLNVDTNRIFLSGWSVGGGGAWRYATSSLENAKRLAGVIPVSPAPGYINLCNIARGNVAVWVHHAKNDGSVPLHFTEDAIDAINSCSPDIPPLVTYYPKGGHAWVADWSYDTLNTLQYPNIFQWMIGTTRSNSLATNKDPVPIAGDDINVILPSDKTVLNACESYDPNDVIIKYRWTVTDGPHTEKVRIERPDYYITNVSGLEPGVYTFRLTVVDEFKATRFDELNVRVGLPPNGANATPFVDAGPDITTSETMFNISGKAKDFDGKIQSYQWRQISGPRRLKIVQAGNVASIVGMVSSGIYAIELSAFDNNRPSAQGKDTLLITKALARPSYFFYYPKKISGNDHTYSFNFGLSPFFLLSLFGASIFVMAIVKKMYGSPIKAVFCLIAR